MAAAAKRDDARAAVDAAAAAFGDWSRGARGMRREILLMAAHVLRGRAADIARTDTEETGGTFGWGLFSVQLAAGMPRERARRRTGSLAR